MGLLRIMMPPRIQLLAVLAFGVAMLLIENQIQRLDESRAKLERTIAMHEVAEVELRHSEDGGGREPAPLAENDDMVIIYNRVPKTASTSFTNIAYDLCGKNRFHVLHINTTKNNPVMSLQDQVRFVRNVTTWREMKPGFYHGHVAYLDFSKFGVKGKPMYINVVRDPIERLVSYYYFLRFGDDYRPSLRRRKQGDKKTFDECVSSGGSDCAPEKLWLQIPFFCGHYSECWNVGSRWALEQAKYNLVNEYLLVGVTEELEDFIMILEAALPSFFKGATELYRTACRVVPRKEVPSEEDHREEAPHQRDDSQAAAVRHLENRKRVLRVCAGTVPVCARSRRQGEGRRALRAGPELLLRKDLPQSELREGLHRNAARSCTHWEKMC